jgi:hypothetical protein
MVIDGQHFSNLFILLSFLCFNFAPSNTWKVVVNVDSVPNVRSHWAALENYWLHNIMLGLQQLLFGVSIMLNIIFCIVPTTIYNVSLFIKE